MSDLLKAARAVDGDEWFVARIQVACDISNVPYSRGLALRVAMLYADEISLTDELAVDASGVTDGQIIDAVITDKPVDLDSPILAQLRLVENQVAGIIGEHLAATGREMGAVFVEPTGYHDAYPLGWVVSWDGKRWESTRHGATGVPGDSPDWIQIPGGDEILPWEQRQAGNEYATGDLVTHDGHVWENTRDRNAWEPGTPHSQWTDLGPVEDYERG